MALLGDSDYYAEIRELVGAPALNLVPDRTLQKYAIAGLEWMADQFRIYLKTGTVALVASTREYTLPVDFLQLVSLTWHYNYLTPGSVAGWARDQESWENTTAAATLSEYALLGRSLILKPPPSAAAVATASTLSLRYLSSQQGLTTSGAAGLSEADQRIGVYHAAREYCASHPDNPAEPWTLGNNSRKADYSNFIKERLHAAGRRAQSKDREYQPAVRVFVSRTGGAR